MSKLQHGQDPKLFAQEGLLLEATEEVWRVMKRQKVRKVDLAHLMGCSSAHVTMILNGTRNMTLRTLSDLAGALGYDVRVRLIPRPETKS